jgi:ribosomal protein L7/L12
MIKIDLSVREALTMISNGCSLDMFEKIVVALESTIDAKEKCHVTITGGMTMKNRISCIKALRQHIGLGLKEAKDWTDGMIGHWDVYGVWHKGDMNQISVRLKTTEAAENLLRDLKNIGCEGYLS